MDDNASLLLTLLWPWERLSVRSQGHTPVLVTKWEAIVTITTTYKYKSNISAAKKGFNEYNDYNTHIAIMSLFKDTKKQNSSL